MSYQVQVFLLEAGDSVQDQTNNNGPKLKHKNMYSNAKNELDEEAWDPQVHVGPHKCQHC